VTGSSGPAHLHAAGRDWGWPDDAPAASLEGIFRSHVQLAASLARERHHGDAWVAPLEAVATAVFRGHEVPNYPVHGDFIPWNLAFCGVSVRAIYDFDNAAIDSRLHDLGEALVGWCALDYAGSSAELTRRNPLAWREHEATDFLASYERMQPLSAAEREALTQYVVGAWWEALMLAYVKGELGVSVLHALPGLASEVEKWSDR